MLDRINEIKNGNKSEREKLIQEYIPFIIKTISNSINEYIETENSEEYIIGLEAFNESIDKYDSSRGGFLSFAAIVIKSRILDYKRKENLNKKIISLNQLSDESTNMNVDMNVNKYNEEIDIQIELKDFKDKLKEFGITISDLVNKSPKHEDTRINAIHAARLITENKKQKDFLYSKKKLPYSSMVSEYKYSRKFLYRNKIFIIATVLLLDSNFDTLKAYINDAERRADV